MDTTMQTPEQIHSKITEMFAKAPEWLHTEVDRLLKSGALDLEEASDDYHVPKLLYVTALRRLAEQYTPPHYDKRGKSELKNLERF